MAVLPTAGIVALAVLVLGPPLGRALFELRPSYTFWPNQPVVPERTETGRYLIALCAPALLAAMTAVFARLRSQPRPWHTALAVGVTQVVTIGMLVACMIGQHRPEWERVYFTPRTLVVAAPIALVLFLATRVDWIRTRIDRLTQESRARRIGALTLAVAMSIISVLPAVNSDRSFAWNIDGYHVAFPLDEAFAVINGLTPLVDFSAQYGSLWPFGSAISMILFGKTLLVFTVTMATATAFGMLAIYGVMRRSARNAVLAALLFLPFVATSFFIVTGTYDNRFSFGTYFAMFPLRYTGPFILAWLTARRIDKRSGSTWPLFLVSGLVMLNNVDFGVAAFAATLVAIVLSRQVSARRLTVDVLRGLAGAMALVTLLTLAVAGSFPHLARLTEFGRLYGLGGFNAIPLTGVLGLPLVIYLTHVAAIGTAAARSLEQQANRVLTGMLAWAGVFGLGAGDYYMLRSHPDTLQSTFSPWTLSLALLAIVAIQAARTATWRRPPIIVLTILYGLGITACSLAQTPTPWSQLHRLHAPPEVARPNGAGPPPPLFAPKDKATRDLVSSLADGPNRFVIKAGAPVAIYTTTGHRMADTYGIVDVVPYTGAESIQTVEQFEASLDALERAGGNTVVIPSASNQGFFKWLRRRGFRPAGQANVEPGLQNLGLQKWVDTRHLRARALH